MTLTAEYSEITTKNADYFKIIATTSAHWSSHTRHLHRRSINKRKNSRHARHAHSHTFRHIRTLTHMTVSMHASLYSSHTSWKKKEKQLQFMHYAWERKKKSSMWNKLLPKKSERGTGEAESQGQWRQPLLQLLWARAATITTGSLNLTIDALA